MRNVMIVTGNGASLIAVMNALRNGYEPEIEVYSAGPDEMRRKLHEKMGKLLLRKKTRVVAEGRWEQLRRHPSGMRK